MTMVVNTKVVEPSFKIGTYTPMYYEVDLSGEPTFNNSDGGKWDSSNPNAGQEGSGVIPDKSVGTPANPNASPDGSVETPRDSNASQGGSDAGLENSGTDLEKPDNLQDTADKSKNVPAGQVNSSNSSNTPATGDSSNPGLWIMLMLLCLAVMPILRRCSKGFGNGNK